MQSPPPFHGYEGQPAPQKRKTNGIVILFAVLGVLLVCCGAPIGFLGYFGFKGFKGAMEMTGCMVNVEAMKKALIAYESAHDGKLPSAKTWQTDLAKYMKVDKDVEGAPMKIWAPGGEWSCEEGNIKTGFSFNEDLSEKKVSDVVKKDSKAIAIFETTTVAFNQSGKLVKLAKDKSPKMIGGLMDEHRGWMLLSADGSNLYSWDAQGNIVNYSMGTTSKRRSKGFDISFDSNSDSGDKGKSGADNGNTEDSKDDNSN